MLGRDIRGRTASRNGRVALLAAVVTAELAAAAVAAIGTAPAGPPAAVTVAAARHPVAPDPAGPLPVSGGRPGAPGSAGPSWVWPRRAWVAVPVATVWIHPGQARPVDAPEIAADPGTAAWLAAMSYGQRLALDDLLATQSLLYDPVTVIGRQGPWDQVVVAGQRGGGYPLGIVGWLPSDQLAFRPPPATGRQATVAVPRLAAGPLVLSYGTRLPVVASTATTVTVATPAGDATVAAAALRSAPVPASGAAVVAEAEKFLGLPYLWAGTSGFGFDCSGLAYSVYRQFGIVLPRDAEDQAGTGRPVGRDQLQPGDLVFFAFGGPIDHVGIYAGAGWLIDAPHTGASVERIRLWSSALAPYYAGARRYL